VIFVRLAKDDSLGHDEIRIAIVIVGQASTVSGVHCAANAAHPVRLVSKAAAAMQTTPLILVSPFSQPYASDENPKIEI
jgi:hypothetical protein